MAEQINETKDKHETEKIKKELKDVVQKLNEEMQSLRTSIRFGFDDKVEELYVSVIDTKTNEEIRKIPSEEALKLAAKMRELIGMLFDKKG
jgi:flagellar protein FlaG